MRIRILIYISVLFALIYLAGCSSSEETTKEKNKNSDVYIFDEVPSDTTVNLSEPEGFPPFNKEYYVVQIGAFTSKDRAEKFAEDSRIKLQMDTNISFNPDVNLFVVQLKKQFKTRKEAENMRDDLRTMNEYKDAWVLSVNNSK